MVSRLSAQLGFDNSNDSNRQTIFEPSDVVAFELGLGDKNGHRYKWGGAVEKRDASGLRYPLFLFLDQFLQVNTELASKKRGEQLRMKEEVEKLNAKKKSLTSFNVSTTDLYFNSVLVLTKRYWGTGQRYIKGFEGIGVLL